MRDEIVYGVSTRVASAGDDASIAEEAERSLKERFEDRFNEDAKFIHACWEMWNNKNSAGEHNPRYFSLSEGVAKQTTPDESLQSPDVRKQEVAKTPPFTAIPPVSIQTLDTNSDLVTQLLRQPSTLDVLQTIFCISENVFSQMSIVDWCPLKVELTYPPDCNFWKAARESKKYNKIIQFPGSTCWSFSVWQLVAKSSTLQKEPFIKESLKNAAKVMSFAEEVDTLPLPGMDDLWYNYQDAVSTYWGDTSTVKHSLRPNEYADCLLFAFLKSNGNTVSMSNMLYGTKLEDDVKKLNPELKDGDMVTTRNLESELETMSNSLSTMMVDNNTPLIRRFEIDIIHTGRNAIKGKKIEQILKKITCIGGLLRHNKGKLEHFTSFTKEGDSLQFYDTREVSDDTSEARDKWNLTHIYAVVM